jgi:hypothetical protein
VINHKIIARQATLESPVINYTQSSPSQQKKPNALKLSVETINELMKLNKIQLLNGMISVNTLQQTELSLENVNMLVSSDKIHHTPRVDEVDDIIENLSFKKGRIKVKDWLINLDSTYFTRYNNRYSFREIEIENQVNKNQFSARNILLDSAFYIDSLKQIRAEAVSWTQAKMVIDNSNNRENKKPDTPLYIFLKNIHGAKTDIDLNTAKGNLSVFLDLLTADQLEKKEKINVQGLKTNGKNFEFTGSHTTLSAAGFSISDLVPSSMTAFRFEQSKNENSTTVTIPGLTFNPDITSFIENEGRINDVVLTKPEFIIHTKQKDSAAKKSLLPGIEINSLQIDQPFFRMDNSTGKGLKLFEWNGRDNKILFKNITSNAKENKLTIDKLNADFTNFILTGGKNKTSSSDKVSLQAELKDIYLQPGDSLAWNATLKYLTLKNFTSDSIGNKHADIVIRSGKLENLTMGSGNTKTLRGFIEKNPSFIFSNISGWIDSDKNHWVWENLSYNRSEKIFSLDSFSYHPALSRDSFIAASPWQTDYMTFTSGKIEITGVNPDNYLDDSVYRAGNLKISNPYFTAYRDKHPPFHAGIIKPFLSKIIQKIPGKVSVDTLQVSDGTVVYSEVSDKTNETGVIPVTRMSGDIFPIKNINLTETDTLRIRINGYVLDSAWVRLRVRESYLDSLSGFLITLRMRPGSLTFLNSFLPALASVRLQSGYLDTLSMRAVGHEYLSLGEMQMFYHDLKVQFLQNGNEEKKKFLTGLATFIANSFVIRKNNKKRVGVVYFPRIRDKSFINYYIKIILSGAASGAGAKKNKKQIRRYKKQLKFRHLPPIDFE